MSSGNGGTFAIPAAPVLDTAEATQEVNYNEPVYFTVKTTGIDDGVVTQEEIGIPGQYDTKREKSNTTQNVTIKMEKSVIDQLTKEKQSTAVNNKVATKGGSCLTKGRRMWWCICCIVLLVVLVIAVVAGVLGSRSSIIISSKSSSSAAVTLSARCPPSYPFVYHNGQYCCMYNREKSHKPHGTKCDRSTISYTSLCCYGNDYIRCSDGKCINHVSAHMCPESNQYAYDKGKYCCKEKKDCNGKSISHSSVCCNDNAYTKCKYVKCRNHYNKVDGGLTDWSDYTACSKTCGDGFKTRRRRCEKPKLGCSGARFEKESCNIDDCADSGRS